MMDLSQWVVCDPDILGGRAVFRGTRVPVEVLFENLAEGLSLAEILDSYPSISEQAAVALLEASKNEIILTVSQRNASF